MTQTVDQIFEETIAFIEQAEGLLDDAPADNMPELKEHFKRLNDAINALPIEERVTYQDKLEALFAALTGLQEKLVAKRDEVTAKASGATTHTHASKAYVQADHRDKDVNPRRVPKSAADNDNNDTDSR